MALFVAVLIVVSPSNAAPRFTTPQARVAPGTAATFALQADGRTIWVDGCVALEIERREGDAWVLAEAPAPCDGSLPARSSAKELTFTFAPPGPGEYRAVAAWGAGCVDERPLALASCKDLGVARSAPFVVEGTPDGAGLPSAPPPPGGPRPSPSPPEPNQR